MGETPIAAGKSSFNLIDTEALFAELAPEQDAVLLDFACGTGAYSLAAAGHLGSAAKVFAFDLWPEGIATLDNEVASQKITRIHTGIVDVTKTIPLGNGSVDICLMATVLHDFISIGSEQGALRETARVLKPGGTLAVIEFKVMDGPPGPPKEIRIAPEAVRALLAPCGFRYTKTTELGPFNYLSLFHREGQ